MNNELAKAFIREAKAIDDKNRAAGTPQRVSIEAVVQDYVDHQQAIDAKLLAQDAENFKTRGALRARQLGIIPK